MFKPRYYQNDAEYAIFEYFAQGNVGNPVVALPTGTGKGVVIGNFIRHIFGYWPNQRIMMLTHVKELISQNAEKLIKIWPTVPLGVYSAGLNSRDMIMPIVFGGVQSVAKCIERCLKENDGRPDYLKHFGFRDLVLIDECHLLGPNEDTMYQFVIAELKKINPRLKVIGFTATPYRLKQGMITDEGLFTDICYDQTGVEAFNRMIAEGFMAPLVGRPTRLQLDVSEVGMVGNDFNQKQLANAVDKDEITYAAVKETVETAHDRHCWIGFASSIDNAEHIAAMLQSFGVNASCVHSKLPMKTNDDRIAAFKAGELTALVNMNKLTTGFDHCPIDLIFDLQPTMSPGKHVQKWGRGTRPSPETGKRNCLGLDFAGNFRRLGPINDPKIPRKPGKGGAGEAPIKICDSCGLYNHASARFCGGGSSSEEAQSLGGCGYAFTFETKIFSTAFSGELLRSDAPIVEYFDVKRVIYNLHEKKNKEGILIAPPSIKVSYFCGLQMFNEWICLEHPGMPSKKARDWWRQRHAEEPPATTFEALKRVSELRMPAKVRVWSNKKYPEILGYEY